MIMLEPSPSGFLVALQQATTKMKEIKKVVDKTQGISKISTTEANELNRVLQDVKPYLDASLKDKKFVQEDHLQTINVALELFEFFDESGKKTVDECLASLFSTLLADLKALKKNANLLGKDRLGDKVKKTSKSKEY